jgi:hypothetical protein
MGSMAVDLSGVVWKQKARSVVDMTISSIDFRFRHRRDTRCVTAAT